VTEDDLRESAVIGLVAAAEMVPIEEEFLAQAEGQIRGCGKLVVAGILAIGQKLVEVKARVGYQGFVDFVTDRLLWSKRSGDKFVAVYEMLSSAHYAPEQIDKLTIEASSLYLIAGRSTSAEVRTEVLEKAARPEGISRAEVERLVEAAKVEATTTALAGKLIYSEDELADEFDKITSKYQKRIERLETQQQQIAKERDRAIANVKTLQTKPGKPTPLPPTFDSNTSFQAMCVGRALKALVEELAITPRQLIDIERELATTIHRHPELATAKLAELKTNAKIVVEWLADLVVALEREGIGAKHDTAVDQTNHRMPPKGRKG
jgi:hypothetical protein